MDLSKTERLILFNQYRILEKLYPEEKEECQNAQKVLSDGYQLEYEELVEYFTEVPSEICKETIDILQMFRCLYFSYEKLDDKTGIKEHDVKFQGFDGNEETDYYSYAVFYIRDKKRFEEFSKVDLNSHYNKLSQYRDMLNVWRQYGRYEDLTKEQILEIVSK